MLPDTIADELSGIDELQKRWGWFVGLGILLIMLGSVAIGYSVVTTLTTMIFIGWLMIFAGILQSAHAFNCRSWGGFFFDLIAGILYTVVGFFMITEPGETSITLTLLIAASLIVSGLFRVAAAIATRFPHWGWLVLSGIINIALGVMIWRQWPLSGLWVIGMFVGIDMLFNGWALFMLGMAAKSSQPVDSGDPA
ncbi:MAG: HdeD family acid-resistance protein [Planctomycetaceae bacterium]